MQYYLRLQYKFDIVDFYPSISESLLWKALQFAKNFTVIDEESLHIIMQSLCNLYKMKHLFGCNCVGLYRDNGLAVLNNISGPKTDRT